MDEKTSVVENTGTTTSLATVDELSIEEIQLSDQIYHGAGLDPIVDAGIRDYENKIEQENKFFNKILGVRGTDIRGYGESVAKRVAVAVYGQLSKQYGGKVGDLRAYIMNLEEERDNANRRYDDLMGRAIGILGEEYKDLKTDSNEFMKKLTDVMGEDLKASRINSEALTEKLADMDGLRSQIRNLMKDKEELLETATREKDQIKVRYESQINDVQNRHKTEIGGLNEKYESQLNEIVNLHRAEVQDLNLRIRAMDKEKEVLADTSAREKEQLKDKHESQVSEINNQHKTEVAAFNSKINIMVKEKELLADAAEKEKEQLEERFEQQIDSINAEHKVEIRNLNEKYESQISELINQHKAELRDMNLRLESLDKEKEILADTSTKEKEQLKERFEQRIASINNEHKVEIRNLNEKYETQINDLHNEYKAEIRKLASRVEILAKEKDLQKEQYESQIADLDSTIRGMGSRRSELRNEKAAVSEKPEQ